MIYNGSNKIGIAYTKRKHGATIDDVIGNVSSGTLSAAVSNNLELYFNGVTTINKNALYGKFYNNTGLKKVEFPDLTTVYTYSLYAAFDQCTNLTYADLSHLTTFASSATYALAYTFYGCSKLTSEAARFPNLTNISRDYGMYYIFGGCPKITSFDLSALTTIDGQYGLGYGFYNCTGLTSASFPALTSIAAYGLYYTFRYCPLTSFSAPNLTTAATYGFYYTFRNVTTLETLSFPSLTTASGDYTFRGMCYQCTGIKHIYFGGLTSSGLGSQKTKFYQMLYGVTGCTVHFPSNLEAKIGTWSDVTAGFSGTNTVVLYDLPATS
ncbi:MAG: leucine-rich repeat protein [Bacilli bacterium]|nr:leucine-rich repeat protein [Bacilli bacterium]